MTIRYSGKNDNHGMGVGTVAPVAAKPAALVDMAILNCSANRARDRAWIIGDQAMRKDSTGSLDSRTRGCL